MPFLSDDARRSYMRGYQAGYRMLAVESWRGAERRMRETHADAKHLETIMQGFRAGVSNRQGEHVSRRKAQWYRANSARITNRRRRLRRQQRSQEAMAAMRSLSAQA